MKTFLFQISLPETATLKDARDAAERAYLAKIIPDHGTLTQVAERAGVTLPTLSNHLVRLGIRASRSLKARGPGVAEANFDRAQ